jgi:hypothetical protein
MTTHIDPVEIPEEPDPVNLLDAVNRLSSNVVTLTRKLDVSQRVSKQARAAVVGLGLLVVVLSLVGGWLWLKTNHAVEANTTNAVQACVNANDTRAANLALWTFVLQTRAENDPNPDPIETANLGLLQDWVEQLYTPHDCNDLDKAYPIPPPPVFTQE